MEKIRLNYIDTIKAFAIILVVMGHAIQQLFGNSSNCENIAYQFIYSFHMPLFMFISGYCAYKLNSVSTVAQGVRRIWNKTIALLLPYIIWGTIRSLLLGKSFWDCIVMTPHGGLWFLLCLYEMFVLLYLIEPLFVYFNRQSKCWKDVILYGTITFIIIISYKLFLQGTNFSLMFDLDFFTLHFKYFIFGYLLRKYNQIERITTSSTAYTIAFLCFWITLYLEYNPYKSILNFATLSCAAYSAIIITYSTFKKIELSVTTQKIASYIGGITLDIYILHMFFFYGLSSLKETLSPLNQNLLLILIISFFLTAINIPICSIFSKLISQSRILLLFLLGKRSI